VKDELSQSMEKLQRTLSEVLMATADCLLPPTCSSVHGDNQRGRKAGLHGFVERVINRVDHKTTTLIHRLDIHGIP
jgi:hypothetical protein